MHRALLIAEIRSLVCTFAADQTLARLAQCCKDFHHPAIRVLWNAISNLSPLVRCFPPDAWTFVNNSLGRCIVSTIILPYPSLMPHIIGSAETRAAACPRGLDGISQVFSHSAKVWGTVLADHSAFTSRASDVGAVCIPSCLHIVPDRKSVV